MEWIEWIEMEYSFNENFGNFNVNKTNTEVVIKIINI
jgi:hypothetical protein